MTVPAGRGGLRGRHAVDGEAAGAHGLGDGLDFGNRRPSTTTTLPLVLTNEGGSKLEISSVLVEDDALIRLRGGNVYRFATVSTAPTVWQTVLPYSACGNTPGIMKSGDYAVFLTCTSNGPLRLHTLKP